MSRFWGIDGCKGGWIAIGLSDTDQSHKALYITDLSEFWSEYGQVVECVLIDMPIGLTDDADGRLAEQSARHVLQKRRSSVFAVPSLSAIAYGAQEGFSSKTYSTACDINQRKHGKKFSVQSWNISAKIHEVNQFLLDTPSAQAIVYESHPEVLFWALNDKQPMRYSKKTGLGFVERLHILQQHQANALDIIRQTYETYTKWMLDDDIVDALICAICARMEHLSTLPENAPRNAQGLPMQMVYPDI